MFIDSPSSPLVTTANYLAVETSVVSSMITEKCDICNFCIYKLLVKVGSYGISNNTSGLRVFGL